MAGATIAHLSKRRVMAKSPHKMKILLTGASGFIGRALLPALVSREHIVTLLSRKSSNSVGIADEIVCDITCWPEAVSGRHFDLCIHLAWIATPGIYLSSPANDLFAEMSPRLAGTLFEAGLPHFFGLGTCIEYAPNLSAPCTPGITAIAPETVYGIAKERARAGIAKSADHHKKGYTWARLFYPYGQGEHPDRIPSSFLRTLLQGRPLELKSPHSVKDWIHINDVVSALMCVAENGYPLREINLGTGIAAEILALATTAAEITGASPDLVKHSPAGAEDPYKYHIADISSLHNLGWKPGVALREGLTEIYKTLEHKE